MSTRRDFLTQCGKVVSAAAFGSVLLPILQACEPTSTPIIAPIDNPNPEPDGRIAVDVSDLSDAKQVKVAPGLRGSDGLPIIITRLAEGDYRALSTRCTHESQEINKTLTGGKLMCPRHNSMFNLDGTVAQGPAAASLQSYDAIYDASTKKLRIKLN